MWHPKFPCCQICRTVEAPFRAKGLCTACYAKSIESKHAPEIRADSYGASATVLTKDYLEREYLGSKRSLGEIAKGAGCSRQYIHKRLKDFGIPVRTLKAARALAFDGQKISYSLPDGEGSSKEVSLASITYDISFFKSWTPAMAWVLGVLYTDGHLADGTTTSAIAKTTSRNPTLNLSQKEPELLEKVLALLSCNARLSFRKRRVFESTVAGAIYQFRIDATAIWEDLHRLGLHPNKSLTVRFPSSIPRHLVRHFIRGCWDGDGSIYQVKSTAGYCAHLVSGSLVFIEGLLAWLKEFGFSSRTIHVAKGSKNPAYYFKYFGLESGRLHQFLYDDVPETMFLARKEGVFKLASEAINKELEQTSFFKPAAPSPLS